MESARALEILRAGRVEVEGQFVRGSNYTFLARVEWEGEQVAAVYKPARGEQPLYDFPWRSLAHREAAAWVFSEGLGWGLVPPTIYRPRAPLGGGSLQLFIDHDPQEHYFTFPEEVRAGLRPAAMFDLAINNADRKAGHFLLDRAGKVWLIDQGLCFHREEKLRTVVWEFAGEPYPPELAADLECAAEELEDAGSALRTALSGHLKAREIQAMRRRMVEMLREGVFPQPPEERRYYPWPPV